MIGALSERVRGAWATRTVCAVGEADVLELTGRDAVDLLHRPSTGDLRPLAATGRVVSTVITTAKGKMVDWCSVISRDRGLLLEVSAGRARRVKDWVDHYTILEDVQTTIASDPWRKISVRGEAAARVAGLDVLPPAGEVVERGGVNWVSAAGANVPTLTGLSRAAEVAQVLRSIVAAGAEQMTAAEVELLRIVDGVPSAAHEFLDEINPLELRLASRAVSFTKGCYVGQEVIARLDTYDKLSRVLMGLDIERGLAPEPGMSLFDGEVAVGKVTSVATLPDSGALGLALIDRRHATEHPVCLAQPGGATAELVNRPFWAGAPR